MPPKQQSTKQQSTKQHPTSAKKKVGIKTERKQQTSTSSRPNPITKVFDINNFDYKKLG